VPLRGGGSDAVLRDGQFGRVGPPVSYKSLTIGGVVNYWLVRGSPSKNDFAQMFVAGRRDRWHTKQPPGDWRRGDRLVFWASSPQREIVALGEFRGVTREFTEDDELIYRVTYQTPLLGSCPHLTELRQEAPLANAIFLKRGPATSVVRLSLAEGEHIYRLVCNRNPTLPLVWGKLGSLARTASREPSGSQLIDLELVVSEGGTKLVTHLARERSRKLAEEKKRAVLSKLGALTCEVCAFDFARFYGALGAGFAEVHHREELAKVGKRKSRLDDLAVVCSNCHRMLHRGNPTLEVEDLRERLLARQTPD
jgi:hypothetical protein